MVFIWRTGFLNLCSTQTFKRAVVLILNKQHQLRASPHMLEKFGSKYFDSISFRGALLSKSNAIQLYFPNEMCCEEGRKKTYMA